MPRYHRQELFPGIGPEGQARMGASKAVIIGCGALGCLSASLLARAGVGHLVLVDRDIVEATNLQRQILFAEADAQHGVPKAAAAEAHLLEVNSDIGIEGIVEDFYPGNAERLVKGAQVIVDATDNFEARYLINDVSHALGIPWIYGAAVGASGLTYNILPGETPCLRCLFENMPTGLQETCDTAGVLGPVPNLIASFQSLEALKILAGQNQALRKTLLSIDTWGNHLNELRTSRDRLSKNCPCCVKGDYPYLRGEFSHGAASLCGRNTVQVLPPEEVILDLRILAERMKVVGKVHLTPYLLKIFAKEADITVFPDGRALFHGIDDPGRARALYARYIGG